MTKARSAALRDLLSLGLVTALVACTSTGDAPRAAAPSAEGRPAGAGDHSYYLTMRDGVRIAVSLHFPGGTAPAMRAPVILIQTRYGRAQEARRGGAPRDIDYFLRQGFAVAIVDTRGSTSSFGPRDVEMGPAERKDMDEIIAHLAARPWSNGKVIGYGISYMADTADFATSRPAPALVASIPRQLDFDAYTQGFMPGGVLNKFLLHVWGDYTKAIDLGRSPRGEPIDCRLRAADCPALFPLLQPVDGDEDYHLLRKALGGRRRWSAEDYLQAPFRDDKGANGFSLFDFSPGSALGAIRREAKPAMIWGSWMDATTAAAALARFRSAPDVKMEIWITANNHGHDINADPFLPARAAPFPERESQFATVLDFTRRVLDGGTIARRINYQVLGTTEFRQTTVWPPEGLSPVSLYLSGDRSMSRTVPVRAGRISYDVDFDAGTGENTRWSTQFGPPPRYPDRREADKRLIAFDSGPLDEDMELAGWPVVDLTVASQSTDPALFAYLEDVAPDGRVTYITEGQLRAIHRAPADPNRLPFDQGPAPHSFNRADALPVKPGEPMRIRFALNPTAAFIRQGHRLRLAIAGADANVFQRYPEVGSERFEFTLGGTTPSLIEVQLRPWR
jgi:putative CocE/NonD family hydrolase